nr:DnaA/Hda family protein [Candidatus Liberibacter sp.]
MVKSCNSSCSVKESVRQRNEEQLFLSFPRFFEKIEREGLLVPSYLEEAVRLIDVWPSWPSPVAVLVGPSGSGKSYLANIWSSKSGCEKLCAIRGLDSVLMATQTKPVLLEDADNTGFSDKELFHIINSVYQHNSSLLLTARTLPINWSIRLPDLRSRLKAATVVKIGFPDDDFLEKVIVKMFSDRQIFIDQKVVSYIIQRMERSLIFAEKLVKRIDDLAFSRGIGITRSLASEVLKEMLEVD